MIQKRIVGIVGCGNVGSAAAYALFTRAVASDLVLVDKNRLRAEGEAMDLMHGQAVASPVDVRSGDYADLADAQVVVMSAGAGRKPGESRLDLLNRNVAIFRDVVAALDEHAPQAIVVVATNPVDVITWVIQQLSTRPRESVIGTGTLLDTARFRALLGKHYGVDPASVHAYILGEHGDSEVPIWSSANIAGKPLTKGEVLGRRFDPAVMAELFEHVKLAGRAVIERKGFTSTAIGLVLSRLVETVLADQRRVLSVSGRLDGAYGIERDVCLSLPYVVGMQGLRGRVLPEITASEREALARSAEVLHKSIEGIDLSG